MSALLRHPFLPGLVLALAGAAHPWLEATMARHMLAELTLLFVAGWLAAHATGAAQHCTALKAYFPAALLAGLLIAGVWMLPLALDLAVSDAGVNSLKVIGLLLSGFLYGACWRHAGLILQGFVVVNWAWMTVTGGLLYASAPAQLCSVYLGDQQPGAGWGLVTMAATVLVCWVLHAMQLPGAEAGPALDQSPRDALQRPQ
jgi:hypothetical protein